MSSGEREAEDMLAEVDLFSGLSRRQVRKLVDRGRTVPHEAGQKVSAEGLGSLAFHLVLDGEATVSVAGTDVRTLGPGDYFGEISMIDGKPRSATVTATQPTKTLAIPHQEFDRLLGDEPDFAHILLKTLCARLREAEGRS
jgi:CRP/FNR family transcriptional regulator, cyclic AMP receptor protein